MAAVFERRLVFGVMEALMDHSEVLGKLILFFGAFIQIPVDNDRTTVKQLFRRHHVFDVRITRPDIQCSITKDRGPKVCPVR